jgi:beta-galactosidase/beta-glucuronidase
METVPRAYIESYMVLPDIDRGEVRFDFKFAGVFADEDVEVEIFDGERLVAKGGCDVGESLVVKLPDHFKLWSPDNPALYTFKAECGKDEFIG